MDEWIWITIVCIIAVIASVFVVLFAGCVSSGWFNKRVPIIAAGDTSRQAFSSGESILDYIPLEEWIVYSDYPEGEQLAPKMYFMSHCLGRFNMLEPSFVIGSRLGHCARNSMC